jgi:hypothetical protein
MKAIFALLFYLLLLPLGFAHEHTNVVLEMTGSFSTIFSDRTTILMSVSTKKSKSCCTDKDAVKVEYKMVVPEGAKYPEPEWYVWIEAHKPDGTPGEYKWVKVPPEKIVEEYSPSGQAYVYLIAHTIQCFVRPQTRY